jgi:hypothetical protein
VRRQQYAHVLGDHGEHLPQTARHELLELIQLLALAFVADPDDQRV